LYSAKLQSIASCRLYGKLYGKMLRDFNGFAAVGDSVNAGILSNWL